MRLLKAYPLAFREGKNLTGTRAAAVMTLIFAGAGLLYFVLLYFIAG